MQVEDERRHADQYKEQLDKVGIFLCRIPRFGVVGLSGGEGVMKLILVD